MDLAYRNLLIKKMIIQRAHGSKGGRIVINSPDNSAPKLPLAGDLAHHE
jgi:hypothetical protein